MDARGALEALARARRSLAVAESFTGGRLLDALTDVPGASRVLRGGIVAYADEAKRKHLGVPEGIVRVHGAVSAEAALAMARGARAAFDADYGVATTGIAGPTGATAAKPLGLAFAAASGPRRAHVEQARHAGDRMAVKRAAVEHALRVLERVLRDEGIL